MPEALREALSGIIDYAGLFPPAGLPLENALKRYRRYQSGAESWILSRFVCPSQKLEALGKLLSVERSDSSRERSDLFGRSSDSSGPNQPARLESDEPGGSELPLAVVGAGGEDLDGFRAGLEFDAEAMTAFDEAFGDVAPIESYEVRSPQAEPPESVLQDLRAFSEIEVYLELPWSDGMGDGLAAVAGQDWLRAKARTGGLHASAFPSSMQLASFLKEALDLDIEFKLTAGLHHPYRAWDAELQANMHGFLNVLAACALHQNEDLLLSEIRMILDDGPHDGLRWDRNGLTWQDMALDWPEVHAARDLFLSFGSCSVEEPLGDLRALGFLKEGGA